MRVQTRDEHMHSQNQPLTGVAKGVFCFIFLVFGRLATCHRLHVMSYSSVIELTYINYALN